MRWLLLAMDMLAMAFMALLLMLACAAVALVLFEALLT